MKNRIWLLLVCFQLTTLVVVAQTPSKRQQVLQVTTGGFISFKSEASSIDNKPVANTPSLSALINSQALMDENRIIHRVITDSQNQVIFGYDLWVSSDPIARKFNLAVLPANDTFRRSFLKEPTKSIDDLFATFPKSAKLQTLDDGDAVSLELLVNRESGVKIVDVVRVTFDSSRLLDRSLETAPKDFTLDAVALTIRQYSLFVDGELAGKGKSPTGFSGALLWFYVPDRGRFIVSLVPREGYAFHKIGVLNDGRIEFFVNGEHYEWISNGPVLASGGTWNLWVLHDPTYSPLFAPEQPITKESKESGPGILQKLTDMEARRNVGGLDISAYYPKPVDKKSPKTKLAIPNRVRVGAADSIEHLMPRIP